VTRRHRALPLRCLAAAALGSALPAAPAAAPGGERLFPAQRISTGTSFEAMAVEDTDGDGHLDLLLTNAPGVHAYLGDGTGCFTSGPTGATAVRDSFAAFADLDADGILDAILVDDQTDDVGVLLGTGPGYAPVVVTALGEQPTSLTVADADDDGDLDVVVGMRQGLSDGIAVLAGDGTGALAPPSFVPLGLLPRVVRFGHLDGDGRVDLVALPGGGTGTIFLADGMGGFASAGSHALATAAGAAELRDLDGDGGLDLVSHGEGECQVRAGDGAGGFGPGTSFATGASSNDFLLEDVDLDGHVDLVVPDVDRVALLRGDGSGAFAAAESLLVGAQALAPGVAHRGDRIVAGDVDGNGAPDLLVSESTYVSVALARSPGELESAVASPLPNFADFALTDMDGDGWTDAVAALAATDELAIFPGDGSGAFADPGPRYPLGPGFKAVALGDLDGDGATDAVASHSFDLRFTAFLGDGAGGLGPGTVGFAGHPTPRLRLADVDADGVLDAVTAADQAAHSFVTVKSGKGDGFFTAPIDTAVPVFPVDVDLGDVDGDGLIDVATVSEVASQATVLLGDGSGSFAGPASYATSFGPRSTRLADVNEDGDLDLLVTAFWLNVRLGDGAGGFGDVAIPTRLGGPIDVADLDGDGHVDLSSGSSVVLGDGAGSFDEPVWVYPGAEHGTSAPFEQTPGARLADVDGDGRADLVGLALAGTAVSLGVRALPEATQSFGTGTPGCSGPLGLVATGAPLIGSPDFGLSATGAPPSRAGLLLFGTAPDVAGTDVFALDFLYHVDLVGSAFLLVRTIRSDAGGTAYAPLPIPDNPSVAGATIYAQAFFAWPSDGACDPSAFGLTSSRGLAFTLQP